MCERTLQRPCGANARHECEIEKRGVVCVCGCVCETCTGRSTCVFDVMFVHPAVEMASSLTPDAREKNVLVPFWPTESDH